MTARITYHAGSLEDVAQLFDRRATQASTSAGLSKFRIAAARLQGEAYAFQQAAEIVRGVVLTGGDNGSK